MLRMWSRSSRKTYILHVELVRKEGYDVLYSKERGASGSRSNGFTLPVPNPVQFSGCAVCPSVCIVSLPNAKHRRAFSYHSCNAGRDLRCFRSTGLNNSRTYCCQLKGGLCSGNLRIAGLISICNKTMQTTKAKDTVARRCSPYDQPLHLARFVLTFRSTSGRLRCVCNHSPIFRLSTTPGSQAFKQHWTILCIGNVSVSCESDEGIAKSSKMLDAPTLQQVNACRTSRSCESLWKEGAPQTKGGVPEEVPGGEGGRTRAEDCRPGSRGHWDIFDDKQGATGTTSGTSRTAARCV